MRRPSSPCPSCGSLLDDSARYCPRCGHATGTVDLDEPTGRDLGAGGADVALGTPRRRWLVAVAVVGVAALLIVVAAFNGGSKASRAEPTSAPPATPPAVATTVTPATTMPPTGPAATATAVPVASQVAAHPEAAGVVVYVANNEGDVVRLDLGTGRVDERTDLSGVDQHTGPWLVTARKGGYVLSSPDDPSSTILGVGDDQASPPAVLQAPFDDSSLGGTQLAPAAEPDEVWLWNQTQDLLTTVRRVRIDGVVTAGPVTLPQFATVLGADGPGALALAGPGGMYRAAVTGTAVAISPVGPQAPVAYNERFLLDLTCNGSLACGMELVDRATRQSHPIQEKAGDLASPYYDAMLSPDGAWLAHVDGRNQPTLTVYDLRGDGPPVSHEILAAASFGPLGQPASFAFSPDGRWLVFLGPTDTIQLWAVDRPQPPVTIAIPGLDGLTALSVAPA